MARKKPNQKPERRAVKTLGKSAMKSTRGGETTTSSPDSQGVSRTSTVKLSPGATKQFGDPH